MAALTFTDVFVTPDGTDSAAIIVAIALAKVTGKRLLLGPGVYTIDADLLIDNARGLVIEGCGMGDPATAAGGTVLFVDYTPTTAAIQVNRSENITIRNLMIDVNGNTSKPAIIQTDTDASGSMGLNLENVCITDSSNSSDGVAIEIGATSQLNNSENTFRNVHIWWMHTAVKTSSAQALNHTFNGLYIFHCENGFHVAGGGAINVFGGAVGHTNKYIYMPWTVNLGYNATHILIQGVRGETKGLDTNLMKWIETDAYTGCTVMFRDIRDAQGAGYSTTAPTTYEFEVGGEAVVRIENAYLQGNAIASANGITYPRLFKVYGTGVIEVENLMSHPEPKSEGYAVVSGSGQLLFTDQSRTIQGFKQPKQYLNAGVAIPIQEN
jgi:hypothetical protein